MNISTALYTDKYEFTMLEAALNDGTADKKCVFEVFNRRIPGFRRYSIVGGTDRAIKAILNFKFKDEELSFLSTFLKKTTLEWLKNYKFTGNIYGYPEGEAFFPYSPILTIEGTFAECVILETVILSILNHDSAIATAATRMKSSAGDKELIELGSRRTHEIAAIHTARIAYLSGFTSTSNLKASNEFNIPATGTSAHSFTLLYSDANGTNEKKAFQSQINSFGSDTTLLVDTYDINQGVKNAIEIAGENLFAIRIDSGDLGVLAKKVRNQLDDLGANKTKIVVSGDLDEYSISGLKAEPIDIFGVGTALVIGSGFPTAELVYKLVEVESVPVSKRSDNKQTFGGKKQVRRLVNGSGTFLQERIFLPNQTIDFDKNIEFYNPSIPLIINGEIRFDINNLVINRKKFADTLLKLPWTGLSLATGYPAIKTKIIK